MKIGIFDSGLGGLFILKELRRKLRQYNYVYLGDTKNLPYGDKSQKQIFDLTRKAVEYLFKQDCALVIVACNTASSQALRKLQQTWLPKSKYKNHRILGIIRPTIEVIGKEKSIGLIGTRRTIDSGAYSRELENVGWHGLFIEKATPKLVPMIESNHVDLQILKDYLKPFKSSKSLILACTHYGLIKKEIQKILGLKVRVISQEDVLPLKLKNYLSRHLEISQRLSENSRITLSVTKSNLNYMRLAKDWFGPSAKLTVIKY